MRRIFIVGFPRSGTTLVQNEMVRRTNLVSFTESHYFFERYITPLSKPLWAPMIFDVIGIRRLWRARHDHFSKFYADNGISRECISAIREDPDNFIESLDNAACTRQADGWIEKTPFHLRRIRKIETLVPDAVFIHVIRKARNIRSSWARLHKNPESASFFRLDVSKVERFWIKDVRRSIYHVKQNSHKHCIIPLGAVQSNPGAAIKAIADWIGIETYDNKKNIVVGLNQFETWKSNNKMATVRQSDYVDGFESKRAQHLYETMVDLALFR